MLTQDLVTHPEQKRRGSVTTLRRLSTYSLILLLSLSIYAQEAARSIPRLIRFSGTLKASSGKTMTGTVGMTFTLYREQQGGAALWMETQNVALDEAGHYSVMLGSTKSEGVPAEFFISGDARWLGIRVHGQEEQARVLLLSVPYALKAGDAETLGGLPVSAFVQTSPGSGNSRTASAEKSTAVTSQKNEAPAANVTGSGTANFVPLWTTTTNIGNSQLFQSTAGNVGLGTSNPGAKLDIVGAANTLRGTTSGATGRGLFGNATSKTGTNFGIYGQTASTGTGASGVFGTSTATSGSNYGVQGNDASANGVGVYGNNTALGYGVYGASTKTGPGGGIGVVGISSSALGIGVSGTGSQYGVSGTANNDQNGTAGVFGIANGLTQANYGVEGINQSANGSGVNGVANAATGGIGVSGTSNASSGGVGVNGTANATTGYANGVQGQSYSTSGNGLSGTALATTGYANGVYGQSSSDSGAGLSGNAIATTGYANGVYGQSASSSGSGVAGTALATTGYANGVYGQSASTSGTGVFGNATATSGNTFGVQGISVSTSGYGIGVYGSSASTPYGAGVQGETNDTSGSGVGVLGITHAPSGSGVSGNTDQTGGAGVSGYATNLVGNAGGVVGFSIAPTGAGVAGFAQASTTSAVHAGNFVLGTGVDLAGGPLNYVINAYNSTTGVFGVDNSGNGYFTGNLHVTGSLSKGSGSFKIDDPLDPANKYLSHSFVESPDMMNVYNGNVVTDRHGIARVTMPAYFEALNRDFRYQLTVIGQFAQAIVAKEISENQFLIKTSKPGVKVSWQVTGIRQDAFANAHRIPVEEEKQGSERGHYLHPELFGSGDTQAIGSEMRPFVEAIGSQSGGK
jgi:hypothetical protein